jgi:hypothetical protein
MFHRARAGFCDPIVLEFLGFDFDPITHHGAVERLGDPRFRQFPVCRYSLAAISVSREGYFGAGVPTTSTTSPAGLETGWPMVRMNLIVPSG